MKRSEAKSIFQQGEDATVSKLLELSRELEKLQKGKAWAARNSSHSSKPPSTDSKKDRINRPKKKKSNRKPGGQPGHPGSRRPLLPESEVQDVIKVFPTECERCSKPLPQEIGGQTAGPPARHQVFEIEPVKPFVTEYQRYDTHCDCGHCNKGKLPPEVQASTFGPRLTAIVAYMTSVMRGSRRGVQEFLHTILGIDMSLGSVQACLQRTSDSLAQVDREMKAELPEQSVLHADETGWNDSWLRIFVSTSFLYFRIAASRGSDVLQAVLGPKFNGVLCVDRWSAYQKYHKGLFQYCWAHIKRDIQKLHEVGDKTEDFEAIFLSKTMESLRKSIMSKWYDFKDGTITRRQLIGRTKDDRNRMEALLAENSVSESEDAKRLASGLYEKFDGLFTFILHDDVEPTNNIAEQGIRPAVQWRKVCFGSRSKKGAVMAARLLTATRTCWLQKRNPLEYLVQAIEAHRNKRRPQSLIDQAA